jgi:DNA-binding CsgD family transcriptional regulator
MADSLTRASLTSREIEVLRIVVTGESNNSVARQLHIEVGTVKSHVSAIMTKLGATSRTRPPASPPAAAWWKRVQSCSLRRSRHACVSRSQGGALLDRCWASSPRPVSKRRRCDLHYRRG